MRRSKQKHVVVSQQYRLKMRTLLIFYSRSGATRKLATAIAAELHADVIEIRCPRFRSGWLSYLRAGYDSVRGILPDIEMPLVDATAYDLVLFGAPFWTSYPALPLRAFLASRPALPARVGLFLAFGGHSPPDKTFKAASALLPPAQAFEATLAVRQRDIAHDQFGADLRRFIQALNRNESSGTV